MKRIIIVWITALAAFVTPVFAGSAVVTPVPAVPESFGLGWYGAIDGGINIYQSYRGNSAYALGNSEEILDVVRQHKLGGFGGLKLGYVIGTGVVRFALEEDIFYNGFTSRISGRVNGVEVLNSSVTANTGAAMTNFLLRFGQGRFQPYFGAGVGGYYGGTNDLIVKVEGVNYFLGKNGEAMHRAKITVDLNFLPNGSPAMAPGLDILDNNTAQSEWMLRAQFQLWL